MIIRPYLLIGAILLFLVSCSDEMTVYQDQLTDSITVENDDAVLQQSVSLTNAGVIDIFNSGNLNLNISKFDDDEDDDDSNEPAGDYPLTQVAQVQPPVFEGNLLTSTHIHIASDYAFVSYNTAGETYLGAVDIIRISNPRNPKLTSRLYYRNADINSLVYDDGYLYIAGGVDAETSEIATQNSFVGKILVVNGKFDISAGISYGFQEGRNATDIKIDGNRAIVSSGTDGTLTTYNKNTLDVLQDKPYDDLRSIALNGSRIAILDAGNGIKILNTDFQSVLEFPITTDLGMASKKTIDYAGNKIVVPEAYKGAGVYDANSGNLLEYIPIPSNPQLENPGDKTTNAVGLNEDILFMANGGAGICLSEERPDGTYGLVGILELDGSMNFLATRGDFVIAASGKTGVQVVKFNRISTSLESRCKNLPEYDGSSKLIVIAGESLAYIGAKRLNNINVSGALLLCGSWSVRNSVIINKLGLFEMNGVMTVGRNSRRRDVRVGQEATLRIEGEVTIFGNLILEDGATLEFIGEQNLMNVFGDVEMGDDVTINGSFVDAKDKF